MYLLVNIFPFPRCKTNMVLFLPYVIHMYLNKFLYFFGPNSLKPHSLEPHLLLSCLNRSCWSKSSDSFGWTPPVSRWLWRHLSEYHAHLTTLQCIVWKKSFKRFGWHNFVYIQYSSSSPIGVSPTEKPVSEIHMSSNGWWKDELVTPHNCNQHTLTF